MDDVGMAQLESQTKKKYASLGALVNARDGETLFRVWAPNAGRLDVVFNDRALAMKRDDDGYFEAAAPAPAGTTYRIRLDGGDAFPDPASRFQPDGVHGPSEVVDPAAYPWSDAAWSGIPQDDLVFYELHVGTFSPEGTFDGVRQRLAYLQDLGVTAIELMPVADFPGRWNWGYDHAALYAPSRAYGRPNELRRLVDEAHNLGMAVFLDVIYNHLGPDGAYVAAFAPMFTEKHHTPWGNAINLDDVHSEGVRSFFIDNALHWLREYHIDGLRLDATHAIVDDSDAHFLKELTQAVETIDIGPRRYLIAEDSRNLNHIIRSTADGGYGLDGVWTDDFHHQIRHLTAGDSDGYYVDFVGMAAPELATTIESGWFYQGQPSRHTGKPRGTDASSIRPDQCVVCIQNHDQVGNRPRGDRIHHEIPLPVYRAASALLLFVPELPLLFMGQEWAASTPFQFFTDHEPELGRLVTEGRKKEFEGFSGFRGEVPDPQDPSTFSRSRLNWAEQNEEVHGGMLNLYRELLYERKRLSSPANAEAIGPDALRVRRGDRVLLVAFAGGATFTTSGGRVVLYTEEKRFGGDGEAPALAREGGEQRVHLRSAGAVLLDASA